VNPPTHTPGGKVDGIWEEKGDEGRRDSFPLFRQTKSGAFRPARQPDKVLVLKKSVSIVHQVANLFETNSASEWLLYISEWRGSGGQDLSNIRVTTKVAVNALLGDTPALADYGSAIMHNLGTKEVKAVVR